MRITFDHHTVPVLTCTGMAGSSNDPLNLIRFRRMNSRWAITAALALAFGTVPLLAAGVSLAQKHESRHEIDQLEDEWRNATLNGDAKTLGSLLADDYMAITASGTLQSRDEALQSIRSGRVRFTSLTITDRKVRFYGTTAVVTSLATIQATTPDGPVAGDYRYTHVYVRDAQGNWKIVSFEASRVRQLGPHRHNELH